jgi:hypothetical protein
MFRQTGITPEEFASVMSTLMLPALSREQLIVALKHGGRNFTAFYEMRESLYKCSPNVLCAIAEKLNVPIPDNGNWWQLAVVVCAPYAPLAFSSNGVANDGPQDATIKPIQSAAVVEPQLDSSSRTHQQDIEQAQQELGLSADEQELVALRASLPIRFKWPRLAQLDTIGAGFTIATGHIFACYVLSFWPSIAVSLVVILFVVRSAVMTLRHTK